MNDEKKPWLFLKRIGTWNPLGDAKEMMTSPWPTVTGYGPIETGPIAPKERKAWKLHARWSLEA